jgi:hypothetical protein
MSYAEGPTVKRREAAKTLKHLRADQQRQCRQQRQKKSLNRALALVVMGRRVLRNDIAPVQCMAKCGVVACCGLFFCVA